MWSLLKQIHLLHKHDCALYSYAVSVVSDSLSRATKLDADVIESFAFSEDEEIEEAKKEEKLEMKKKLEEEKKKGGEEEAEK